MHNWLTLLFNSDLVQIVDFVCSYIKNFSKENYNTYVKSLHLIFYTKQLHLYLYRVNFYELCVVYNVNSYQTIDTLLKCKIVCFKLLFI